MVDSILEEAKGLNLKHLCTPACDHGANPLEGVELAKKYDISDYEQEVHECDDGCSDHNPMSEVKVSTEVDLGAYAELGGAGNHTYTGTEAAFSRLEVVTSTAGSLPAAESVTTVGLFKETSNAISVVSAALGSEAVQADRVLSKGEFVQPGGEARAESNIIQESTRAPVGRFVSAELDATRAVSIAGNGIGERSALNNSDYRASELLTTRGGNSVEVGAPQVVTTDSSKGASGRTAPTVATQVLNYTDVQVFARAQGVAVSSVLKADSQVNVAAGAEARPTTPAESPRYSAEGNDTRVQESRAVVAGVAAPERFLGWASEKPPYGQTIAAFTQASQSKKPEERSAGTYGNNLRELNPPSAVPSSRAEPKSERFMGWATDRQESRAETNVRQTRVVREREAGTRKQAFVSAERDGPAAQGAQTSRRYSYPRSQAAPVAESQRDAARVVTQEVGAPVKRGPSESQVVREPGALVGRDGAGRAISQSDTRYVGRNEVVRERVFAEKDSAREPLVKSPESIGQRSARSDSRQGQSKSVTNDSFSSSVNSEMTRSGRVDKRQSVDTIVYARQEVEQRDISRSLRKVERLISERYREVLQKLSERLARQGSRRAGTLLVAEVNQLALSQLASMNQMLELLSEDRERYEEIFDRSGVRRQGRIGKNRLQRYRGRLAKKRKAQKTVATARAKVESAPPASPLASATPSPLVTGQSSVAITSAHTSGPSKSLDIFQAKADDDSESDADVQY